MEANSVVSLALILDPALGYFVFKKSHNPPALTTHTGLICKRRGGKCNSHFLNLICRLDIKEVRNMCLMTSGYVYA